MCKRCLSKESDKDFIRKILRAIHMVPDGFIHYIYLVKLMNTLFQVSEMQLTKL